MKLKLFVLFMLVSLFTQAQKIRFEYDDAGNQIQRKWCPSCLSRNAQETYKEISNLEETDMQKFFPEDVISYYPNPVKEELFLKWELVDENKVSSIDVFTLNGQVLRTIKENLSQNSLVISFQEYPIGVYFLSLNYTNGDQKNIKIIKN
ncbi:T9SS type A sorting domain-containing protein [Flavobacterium sp. UBA7663]|uniref:T9SS type A sorting domain-containing protein n=1 Tax=Flavobacterium sp. UBA7663 TaxID=1946557 RepID=UPI0025C03F82|nr:T9SS type A sorting domain-containing protein [Flavobacterium sp. UBA7663]